MIIMILLSGCAGSTLAQTSGPVFFDITAKLEMPVACKASPTDTRIAWEPDQPRKALFWGGRGSLGQDNGLDAVARVDPLTDEVETFSLPAESGGCGPIHRGGSESASGRQRR